MYNVLLLTLLLNFVAIITHSYQQRGYAIKQHVISLTCKRIKFLKVNQIFRSDNKNNFLTTYLLPTINWTVRCTDVSLYVRKQKLLSRLENFVHCSFSEQKSGSNANLFIQGKRQLLIDFKMYIIVVEVYNKITLYEGS